MRKIYYKQHFYPKLALSIKLSSNSCFLPGYNFVLQRAFTLAEIFITLTIIGIVAAMTIPTLVSKYQKHAYVVGLKKAYSTLQNAIAKTPPEENCSAGDYNCVFNPGYCQNNSYSILKKQLKVAKSCDLGHFSECVPQEYKYLSGVKNTYGPTITSSSTAGVLVLEDGMTIFAPEDSCHYYTTVDVNGNTGPNIQGRDLFHFIIDADTGRLVPMGSKNSSYYGSNSYWKETTDCQAGGQGMFCAARVLEEDAMNY